MYFGTCIQRDEVLHPRAVHKRENRGIRGVGRRKIFWEFELRN